MGRAAGSVIHRRGHQVMLAAVAAALVALLAALTLAGGRPVAAPAGLPDAGAATAWGLRIVRLLAQVSAVMTVGSLLVGALIARPGRTSAGRAAVPWALAWVCTSATLVALTAAQTLGMPVQHVNPVQLRAVLGTDQSVGLQASTVMALAVALAATRVSTRAACRGLLGLAVLGLLPSALVGHATTSADADMAVTAIGVHVVAASLWTGGLAAVLLLLRRSSADLASVLPRFSQVALGCYIALGISGLLGATARLGTSLDSWGTGYGAVISLKVVLLVVLGALGHRHRTATIRAALGGRSLAFLRLAAGEVVVMAAALGLAVALTAIPPPPSVAPIGHVGTGAGLGYPVPPFGWWALATAWRLDAAVLMLLGTGLVAYMVGVARLSRLGLAWPRTRTAAFVSGLGLVLLDLCSGVATFAPAMVSVQVGQLLVALLLAPLLLATGQPDVLWARVRERTDAPAAATACAPGRVVSPITGATLVCLVLVAVYRTPLIEFSLRSHWVSRLVLLTAIASGLVLWVSVRDHTATRRLASPGAWSLVGVASSLALLAAQLAGGDRLLAGSWFRGLAWSWVDPVADQRWGALLMGLAAASFAAAVVAHPETSPRLPPPAGHRQRRTRPLRSSAATGP